MNELSHNAIDALLPPEMAERAEFWQAAGRTPAAYAHLTITAVLANLLWVTLGNMVGGLWVGITYWFIYLRRRPAAARIPA